MSDFDSPWKEALDRFLPAFLAFFFPEVHVAIDWNKPYESLEKELQRVAGEGELGLRLADKLFKVWRRDGEEAWVLIHIEVQSQADDMFAERMYIYNYRVYDKHRRPVVSLAVLGDSQAQWRPSSFGYELWGCKVRLEFPVVKLLDYQVDLAALEAQANPFALVVLAHLQTMATRQNLESRKQWKTRVVKGLFERGLEAEAIRQLFRLIDWMMDLPQELEKQFHQEIHAFEEEMKMPYVTSIERIAREEGLKKVRKKGAKKDVKKDVKKGRSLGCVTVLPSLWRSSSARWACSWCRQSKKSESLSALRNFEKAIRSASSVEDLRKLFN